MFRGELFFGLFWDAKEFELSCDCLKVTSSQREGLPPSSSQTSHEPSSQESWHPSSSQTSGASKFSAISDDLDLDGDFKQFSSLYYFISFVQNLVA